MLKSGGKLVSISGPPAPAFAEKARLPLPIRLVLGLSSGAARRQAKKLGVEYTFLFMRAEGKQLEQITRLIDAGTLEATVDKVFPFHETPQALSDVAGGSGKGKVVVHIRD
ncbi:zinc-binding dehydrogenase [Deinococcus sp. UYEF24]